jgi:hypothetical protein
MGHPWGGQVSDRPVFAEKEALERLRQKPDPPRPGLLRTWRGSGDNARQKLALLDASARRG